MKKALLIAILFIFSLNAYPQVQFEEGYFVDNQGKRTECLIKNADKLLNPTQFEYKLSENSEVKVGTISSVKEFEILNTVHKYQRFKVNIDRSSNNVYKLSNSAEPTFSEEELFLRVSVEGKASLYSYYVINGLEKYFYSMNGSDVEQLVFKKYWSNDNSIKSNETYKKQLWDKLMCQEIPMDYFENADYEENDLVRLVVKYNECLNSEFQNYSARKKKGELGLSLKAGLNTTSLEIEQKKPHANTNSFERKVTPQVGFEAEYIFGFNKKKWAVFFEPTFLYYKYRFRTVVYNNNLIPSNPGAAAGEKSMLEINYSYFTLPLGFRHYLYLNEESKLFFNGALAYNLVISPSTTFGVEDFSIKPEFNQGHTTMIPGFIVGFGYKHRNRYSIEAGYQARRYMLDNSSWTSSFNNSVSVVFGYRIR